MYSLKAWLAKHLPNSLMDWYHKTLAQVAAWRYHYPSRRLVVIGVTGTKGKTTTSNLLWHILTHAGYKVGMATTANFRIGDKHWLNDTKMTMLGRSQLQKLLADMVAAKCEFAIIETSSEGIKQWRHLGIEYDTVVWTNLFPEHLDAHGSFENYKAAKLALFHHLSLLPMKQENGQSIVKAAVLNGDSEYIQEFMQTATVGTQVVWSRQNNTFANMQITNLKDTPQGLHFKINDYDFFSPLLGEWNMDNIASAIGAALVAGVSYPEIVNGLATFTSVPGRMEKIQSGQPFTVIIDYAYEPVSLRLLYTFWRKQLGQHRLITLMSSTGGGRDVSRRAANGAVAGELCHYVIVTDEDPYDDKPETIIDQVAAGVISTGKVEGTTMWKVLDRRAAMLQALQLAQPDDVVIFPCKGADQKICRAHGKKEPWDDRTVARQLLEQMGYGR